ncbi:MAG: proprotein convertase P-domain-containing protein [Phycisphaerales bacterium]|nr:proprotein convertase P-domain-containing protein [Phycisphaerales bacterium]MCB9864821.1 proprotein convertase P-domain-containing protein [Phycisphaerales bacterium]
MRNCVFCRAIVIALLCFSPIIQADDTPETAGERVRATITELPDGRLLVDGVTYESRTAYYRSAHFRRNGGPCGTPAPDFAAAPRGVGGAGDCDYFSTTLSSDYLPDVGRFRIPVVVHVITSSNGTGALNEDNIRAQIDVLNEAFRGNGGLGANAEIEFYLATEDPSGNPTNGITTIANNAWFIEDGDYWLTLAWDPFHYLNIYTLNLNTDGTLGYVPRFPAEGNFVGSLADRVVVHWGSFGAVGADGPPNDTGDVLVHEVGHYLGLFHTFMEPGLCSQAVAPGCYTDGDLICDTNPHLEALFTHNCSDVNTDCGLPAPTDNFMSYSEELCMYRFTPEQVQRMRCTLLNYRSDLYDFVSETGRLGVTPTSNVEHAGLVGGPFTPIQTVYVIKNTGNSPVDYDIDITNNFGLLLNGGTSAVSGSLAPGANRLITVALDTDIVHALPTGSYVASVVFNDQTSGAQFVRTHTLTAGELRLCSTGAPKTIPDGSTTGAATTIVVSQNAIIEDLDIDVEITHSWIGDITVTLTHVESGKSALLINQIGGSSFNTCFESDLNDVRLDDEGTGGLIENQCRPGLTSPPSYRPQNPLSTFKGMSVDGTWELRARDLAAGATGTLDHWCLIASVVEPAVVEVPDPNVTIDSDLDSIPDTSDNCPQTPNTDQSDINNNGVGDACEGLSLGDCPSTITLPATSKDGRTIDFELPASAGGFGNIQVSASPKSGSTFPIGTTNVKITATDATGSIVSCTFDVVVTDDPTITDPIVEGENCGGGSGCGAGGAVLMPLMLLGTVAFRRRMRKPTQRR